VSYVPDRKIVESKSFKLYLWSYRNEGVFHEHLVNTILDDLVATLDPHYCLVKGVFDIRGGIGIEVLAEHQKTPGTRDLWVSYISRRRSR
jgi:7-cyano-7-deazaguanine reductase